MKLSDFIKKVLIIGMWVGLWQLAAVLVGNRILLVGPSEVLGSLAKLWPTEGFWLAVGGTTGKVLAGFLLGSSMGFFAAGLGYRFRLVRQALEPFVAVMRSIPIVSFVILLLIWQGSTRISMLISLMVAFPIMYVNTLNGLLGMREELVQTARLLQVRWHDRVRYIYLPEIFPELKSGLELSVSMGFKGGIAAEVIGQPVGSIGNALYQSKILLETGDVLAYTLMAICIAWGCEKWIVWLWSRFLGPRYKNIGVEEDAWTKK